MEVRITAARLKELQRSPVLPLSGRGASQRAGRRHRIDSKSIEIFV